VLPGNRPQPIPVEPLVRHVANDREVAGLERGHREKLPDEGTVWIVDALCGRQLDSLDAAFAAAAAATKSRAPG